MIVITKTAIDKNKGKFIRSKDRKTYIGYIDAIPYCDPCKHNNINTLNK